ncbi:MAG: hypothetical protein ABI831_18410 [Betaproteobacteria bacterium]
MIEADCLRVHLSGPSRRHPQIAPMSWSGWVKNTIFSFPVISIQHGSNAMNAGDRLFRRQNVLTAGSWIGAHGVTQALPRAPLFSIVRNPSLPNSMWFVGTDVGVFRTDDGGTTWTNATAPLGLPNTLVRDLRLSADGNTLYGGTFGRGVWSMDIRRSFR